VNVLLHAPAPFTTEKDPFVRFRYFGMKAVIVKREISTDLLLQITKLCQ